MDLIDNELTLERVDNLLNCILIAFTSSELYQIKRINAYEIDEETDLALLVSISRKGKNKNINEFDTLVYQFLDFASNRFSAVEKQFIYLHYFLGIGLNKLNERFYDNSYNCTYYFKAHTIDKKIRNKLLYVFPKVVKYKDRKKEKDKNVRFYRKYKQF